LTGETHETKHYRSSGIRSSIRFNIGQAGKTATGRYRRNRQRFATGNNGGHQGTGNAGTRSRMVRGSHILGLLAAVSLAGCATAPQMAPRFVQPSTAPIQASVKAIREANASTKAHITQATVIVRTIHLSLPEDQLKIDALTAELDAASNAVAVSSEKAAEAEGARDALDVQLRGTTELANKLADAYDKQGATITSLRESRHSWVKRFWIASGIALAAGLWIFRKPLLMVAGGL
jgi:hypothetical protein